MSTRIRAVAPAAPSPPPEPTMKLSHLALVLPLLAFAPACNSLKSESSPASATGAEEGMAGEKKDGDKGDKKDADEEETTADKLKKAEHGLEDARAELKIARQECQAGERKQKDEVEEAEYGLAKAREALEVFQRVAKPLELSKIELSLDRSAQSVQEIKQELEEIMAMYKKEDFASLTKELVISRSKKRLEFENREMEHEKTRAATERDVEIPRKEKDLDLEVKKAEAALREARAEQAKSADENELKMKKAERAVDDAEKELAKLKAQAAKEKAASKDAKASAS